MVNMVKYEWKKIWGSKLTQLAMIGCSLFFIFCVYSNISQITAVDSEGNTVSGIAAVSVLKEVQGEQKLDQNTIDKIMQQYLGYVNNPETNSEKQETKFLSEDMYKKYYLPNKALLGLIAGNYRDLYTDTSLKDSFENGLGKDYYQKRSQNTQIWLENKVNKNEITPKQMEYWISQDNKVGQYTYGYCEGWKAILSTLTWPVLIMMIICIGISPIFAGEYQSKCDSLVLCMRFGKIKLAKSKIIAAWLYTSCVYWGITLLYSFVYLIVLGTGGKELPIQLNYPSVPVSYPLTMLQACLLVLALGYILTLGMMGITLFMSSLFKNTYGVIIVAFLMLIVPTFLSPDTGGYLWRHLLSLLPAKIADFSFEYYIAYSIGGKVLSWPSTAMIVNMAFAIIFSVTAAYTFKRHQVNR